MAKCMYPTKSGVLPILLICVKHNWLTFSKMGESVFSEKGFQNWKKAIEKFTTREGSHLTRKPGEMDGQRKDHNWKSGMFTNVSSSKDKSRFSVSIEGSTISCSPGNCISRPR